jgi:cobalt-zinc-cadmium efflux system outer membrane protein
MHLLKRHQIISALLLLTLAMAATGCTGYRRRPLVERQVFKDLQSIQLQALKGPDQGPLTTAEGLSLDEAVAAGLYLNPDLRAFRRERGVAEGELVSARLVPNPEIAVSTLANLPGSGRGLGSAAASFIAAFRRPGERSGRVASAQARLEAVNSQISAQEWKLAADIRKAYLTLLGAEEQFRLAEASVKLQQRIKTYYGQKFQLGDASRLDLNLVNIEFGQALRDQQKTLSQLDQARQSLNRLLGLPPSYALKLRATSDILDYKPICLDLASLELAALDNNGELSTLRHEYDQAEQDLRVAYLQRVPWFRLGPSFERESGGGEGKTNRLGLAFGLDLPIFNFNQGEIAIREAKRDKVRDEFTAKLHAVEADLNEAFRNLQAQEQLVRLFKDSIQPALEENAQLTEAGFQVGELNLIELIATQDRVLKSRRDYVDTELEYWKAVVDLEAVSGVRVPDKTGVKP